jgi:hypothetical protein
MGRRGLDGRGGGREYSTERMVRTGRRRLNGWDREDSMDETGRRRQREDRVTDIVGWMERIRRKVG